MSDRDNDLKIMGYIFAAIGSFFALVLLYGTYLLYRHGHNLCTSYYSEKELLNILKRDPSLGEPVHQVDGGIFSIRGHKFLYPDKVPLDPNFFGGLMTLEQFAHVMIMINTALIKTYIGGHKYGTKSEALRTQGYIAATTACRQATNYLMDNNVRAVVYQTTDYELRKYVNGVYQRTDWDTSIYISFRDDRLEDSDEIEIVLWERGNPVVQDQVPVATVVVPFTGSNQDEPEFAHIPDGAVQKLARDLRIFYTQFDSSRTTTQIEAAAKWATEHGVPALNAKLKENMARI